MAPTISPQQPRAAAPAEPPLAPDHPAAFLNPRQQSTTSSTTPTDTIPSFYGSLGSGPDPGAVAGITLGSVAGFVLLLWLVYTCINMGNAGRGGASESATVVTEGTTTASVLTRKSRRQRNGGVGYGYKHRDRRGSGTVMSEATVEIRRGGSRSHSRGGGPVIVEEVRMERPPEVVIMEESRRRSFSRPPVGIPVPPPPMGSSVGGSEDEVVVIEEHTPPRRRSRVRSVERRSSGYREVDPERFAGGDASFVEVRRSSSHRR